MTAGPTVQNAVIESAKTWPDNGFTFEKRGDQNVFYSFTQIEQETACRAAALAALGVTKGDRILLRISSLRFWPPFAWVSLQCPSCRR
jgi:hypothetical protein